MMKKFLLKVLLFFALVVVMDFAFGYVFLWLRTHAKGGSTANCEYIANRTNEDIIILGSSRATHHYVPQIFEDSLGMTCYNCGEEGNGIVLAYGRFKLLTKHYHPKLIIYEVTPGSDYIKSESYSKYLGYLRQYYNDSDIKQLFRVFGGQFVSIKMQSKMFQNTSKLLPNVVDNIIFRDNKKGYAPLNGSMKAGLEQKQEPEPELKVDSLKLAYIEKLILDARNSEIPLVFVVSPRYNESSDMLKYQPIIYLCEKYGVPFLNYKDYPPIASDSYYFQDIGHMNHFGAEAFTNVIVEKIKDLNY